MNSDSLNMVSRLGEGHMPWTFFLSEPQLKTTVDPVFTNFFSYAVQQLLISFFYSDRCMPTQDIDGQPGPDLRAGCLWYEKPKLGKTSRSIQSCPMEYVY